MPLQRRDAGTPLEGLLGRKHGAELLAQGHLVANPGARGCLPRASPAQAGQAARVRFGVSSCSIRRCARRSTSSRSLISASSAAFYSGVDTAISATLPLDESLEVRRADTNRIHDANVREISACEEAVDCCGADAEAARDLGHAEQVLLDPCWTQRFVFGGCVLSRSARCSAGPKEWLPIDH